MRTVNSQVKFVLQMAVLASLAGSATGHVFVFEQSRVAPNPPYEGSGWFAEVFLDLPDGSATHLTAAENYVVGRKPDFTFRTDWIDFPAGPVADGADADFETLGDFLDDYIYDVSDPSKLNRRFGHLLIRFYGLLRVTLDDSTGPDEAPTLPVWVEMGTLGWDGFRTRIVDTIYRLPVVVNNPFMHENSIVLGLGLFPVEVTYFNRYDPTGASGSSRAGIEFYSWLGGGLPWPGGNRLIHVDRGPATIVPPSVIYQPEDLLPFLVGDFDADFDVDLYDLGWFQVCHSGSGESGGVFLNLGCRSLDADSDGDVDAEDLLLIYERIELCGDESDCDDGELCTVDRCLGNTCVNTLFPYGDVDHNGTVNLLDLFCLLDAFADVFERCTFDDVDLEPCGGNDTINLLDIFAILDAFSGVDPCCQ